MIYCFTLILQVLYAGVTGLAEVTPSLDSTFETVLYI